MTSLAKLRSLLQSMRTELYLAERNYGLPELNQRKYRDLLDQQKGRVQVLRKLLAEAKRMR